MVTKNKQPVKKPKTKAKAKAKSKPIKKPKREIVYPEVEVLEFIGDSALTVEQTKSLLGWTTESENIKFGNDYLFKDLEGNKIRLLNNTHNRPFQMALARDWMIEHLKGRWKFNGQGRVIDRLGQVQSGQHSLAGLVLAAQECKLHPSLWRKYWHGKEPTMETLVVVGISEADDVINTLDTGKPRSLADVIYRSAYFSEMDLTGAERTAIARICSYAIRLLWQRTGYDQTAFLCKRSHSEALDYLNVHERVLEAVKHIYGERESLRSLIPEGYAAGLLYLMASSATPLEDYDGSQESLDFKLWDDACDFWVLLSSGADKVKPLKEKLDQLELSGSYFRDQACALVAKAWVAITDGKPVKESSLKLELGEDDLGRPILLDHPTVGGIDRGGLVPEKPDE